MARIVLHIHKPGRRATVLDLSPKKAPDITEQYADLVHRLMAAIEKQKATNDVRPAAGVACYAPGGTLLLMKRRPDCSDHPGEWAFPAGGIDPGETPENCARREFREETGRLIVLLQPFGAWDNFLCFKTHTTQFVPRMCREHTEYTWADPKNLPQPIHPGVLGVLANRLVTHDDAEDDKLGQWITIHGAHVFINGEGKIIKGPAHLVGQHKDEIGAGHSDGQPKKSVKQHVYELMSSGKPFSLPDLHKVTGAKYEKQIYNAIVDMNAGKGPVAGLKIEKVGPKTWQIVNADGTPAPAAPDGADPFKDFKMKPDEPTVETPAETQQEPPQAPEPAPVAPTPTPAKPFVPFGSVAKPPAVLLSKSEADEKYHGELTDATDQAANSMQMLAEDPGGVDIAEYTKSIAQEWKQTKANAMAQWAANFKGGEHVAKPVEVFPEDIALMDKLALANTGEEKAKAIADWKAATLQAKKGPAKPVAPPAELQGTTAKPAAPPPPAPKIDVTPTGGPALQAPDNIVPDDHQHISHDDFASTPDAPEGEYVKQQDKLHALLHGASLSSVENKKRIQKALDAELTQSAHFKSLDEQYRTNGPGKYSQTGSDTLAAKLISQWASSSGNHHAVSVAAQLATRDAFKMNPANTETKAFHILDTHGGDENKVFKQAADELGIQVGTPEKMASFKAGLQDFALAQYHATQKFLAEKGVKHLYLVRGMKVGSSSTGAQQVNVKMQPASSFTTAHGTATSFASEHSLFVAKVPASQVLGSFITGYGCTSESEVVVLNHDNLKMIKVGTSHAPNQTTMAKHIKNTLSPSGATGAVPGSSSSTPKPKPAGAFKPHSLPPIPAGTAKGWAGQLKKAAQSGDPQTWKSKYDLVMGLGANLPKTKGYAKELNDKFNEQHKAWLESQAAKAAKAEKKTAAPTTKSTVAPTTAEGVKKNAHYYKKLKAAVLGHPLHSDAVYTGLKAIGHSNEAILKYYQDQQAKHNGAPS